MAPSLRANDLSNNTLSFTHETSRSSKPRVRGKRRPDRDASKDLSQVSDPDDSPPGKRSVIHAVITSRTSGEIVSSIPAYSSTCPVLQC